MDTVQYDVWSVKLKINENEERKAKAIQEIKDNSSSVLRRRCAKAIGELDSRIDTLGASYVQSVDTVQKKVKKLTLETIKIKKRSAKAIHEMEDTVTLVSHRFFERAIDELGSSIDTLGTSNGQSVSMVKKK